MTRYKDGDVVKRNGNYFRVKKGNDGHYYVSLLLGFALVTSWHRISVRKLNEYYVKVDNYTGKEKKWL